MEKRKYDTTRGTTCTPIEVKKEFWYQFKLIFGKLGKRKNEAIEEAICDFNEKNKGVL